MFCVNIDREMGIMAIEVIVFQSNQELGIVKRKLDILSLFQEPVHAGQVLFH